MQQFLGRTAAPRLRRRWKPHHRSVAISVGTSRGDCTRSGRHKTRCDCLPRNADDPSPQSGDDDDPHRSVTGDPIRFGLVSNLARPGGNVTGVSVDAGVEVWAKRLELLSIAVPKLVNVVFVSSEGAWTGAGGQAVRDAAQKLGISLVRGTLSSPHGEAEYRSTFSSLQRDQLDGLILSDEGHLHLPQKSLLVQLIQQLRLPAIYPYREFAEAGGLMSYSSDLKSLIRRQAAQIVEILRGANPGDIPYSQAERFELVVNLKTAKELGIEIPDGLVAGATAVIE